MHAAGRSRVATIALSLAAAVSLVLAIGSVTRVIVQRSMDHDELEHLHATWLVSVGDVPFRDFFEVHPPFPWMALAPLARGAGDEESLLLRLRALSALLHAATILLLAANMRLGRRESDPLWTAAALLAMLNTEGTQGYFAEFRVDAWSNAAMLGAILAARLPKPRYALFGFLAAASVLWSPKLVALGGIFALVELVRLRRAAWRAAAAMMAGGAAAVMLAGLALRAGGIDLAAAYALTVRYHALLLEHGGFGSGLARTLWDQRVLSGPALGGMLAWLVFALRGRLRPNAFEIAVALFLIVQLLLVPLPYKQYFTPWLLLAAVFLPFLPLPFERVRVLRTVALPLALLFVAVRALLAFDLARSTHSFARAGAFWEFMDQFRGAERRVVAPVVFHPILARDSMYAWVGTTGPDTSYGPEAILRELRVPGISERFTYDYYLRELAARPPDVVMFGDENNSLPRQQEAAVRAFIRASNYERRVAGWYEVWVRPPLPVPRSSSGSSEEPRN